MSSALIMTAIQATLKLGAAARKAYVDSTRDRSLILPPLKTFSSLDAFDANNFFNRYKERFLTGTTQALHPKAQRIIELQLKFQSPNGLNNAEATEFIGYCKDCKQINALERGEDGWVQAVSINQSELDALVTLGTWTWDGQENPKWWMTISEAIFDIGLEYAMADPRICNPATTSGQALKTFLKSWEEIELVSLKKEDIPLTLITTVLDIASTYPEIITGGQRGQKILSSTTKALSGEISTRLQKSDSLTDKTSIEEWGCTIYRTILTSAGRMAVEDPGAYLGIQGEKSEAMASAVGGAVLDLILSDTTGTGYKKIFDGPGLEKVTRAALSVVAQHPDIVLDTDNQGINELVSAMATDLAQLPTPYTGEVLPEVLRLLLENSAGSLELVWQDRDKPSTHLLLLAAKKALTVISAKPAEGQWKLEFTQADAVDVVECVCTELKANPTWLLHDASQFEPLLEIILDQAVNVIRAEAGPEVTREAAKEILFAAIPACLNRAEFSQHITIDGQTKAFFNACLETILAAAFKSTDMKARCRLTSARGLELLLDVAFDALERTDLSNDTKAQEALDKLKAALDTFVQKLEKGEGTDFSIIETALA